MRNGLCAILVLCGISMSQAQPLGVYQHGTVMRMRMGDCLPLHHGFVAVMGGPQMPMVEDSCPEYTLVSDKVVFVIVGKSSNQLIPLADVIDFRMQKNELAVRLDDVKKEARFTIKEMILRTEWERVQQHIHDQLESPSHAEESISATRERE